MLLPLFSSLVASLFILSAAEPPQAKKEPNLEQVSHAFGYYIAKNLIHPDLSPLSVDAVIQGIRDRASGKEIELSEEAYEKALSRLHDTAYQRLMDKNTKEATSQLKIQSAKADICTLGDKVQYSIERTGIGETVEEHATPLVHFKASHPDGTIFNQSKDGEPVPLNLDETYPGFAKAIAGMKEGEKRRVFLHPDEVPGLGDEQHPGSLVIFDIEVVKAQAPAGHDLMEERAGIEKELEKALAIQ